jgi:hypothetical protein
MSQRKLCIHHLRGYCRFGPDCKFSHETPNQRSLHKVNSEPCRNYKIGYCKFGTQCKFSHDIIVDFSESIVDFVITED